MAEKPITYIKGREKQEINLEYLRNEMAQILQIDNLSFFIGAGCSSNIVGGHETGIPSMTTIYDGFFKENPDFEIAGVKVNGYFCKNLEKMIETMGAILIANEVSVVDSEIEEKIKCVNRYLREQILKGIKEDALREIYKDFYSRIAQKARRSPISVFTSNYDLFNEIALDELGFPYNNGFSGTYKRKFSPASYNYIYVENMNLNRDIWEQASSFYNLVKLHGSISWVRKDNRIWEQDYESISNNDTVMIFPTPLKDRSTLMTPYSDLFRIMENRIMQKNSTLVVMGYSFGDDHINSVILNGLAIPTFRLVVFGKSSHIDKLVDIGDSRITIINSEDKIHYFKNIVEEILPFVHPDIKEELEMQPINRLINDYKKSVDNE